MSLLCQNYRGGRATNGRRPDLGIAPAAWKFRNFSRWCQIVSVNPRPVGVLKIPVSAVRFRPCPPAMIGTSWHGSRIPLRGASCLSPTCSRSGSGLRPSKPCGLQPVIRTSHSPGKSYHPCFPQVCQGSWHVVAAPRGTPWGVSSCYHAATTLPRTRSTQEHHRSLQIVRFLRG